MVFHNSLRIDGVMIGGTAHSMAPAIGGSSNSAAGSASVTPNAPRRSNTMSSFETTR